MSRESLVDASSRQEVILLDLLSLRFLGQDLSRLWLLSAQTVYVKSHRLTVKLLRILRRKHRVRLLVVLFRRVS